MLVTKHL